jgi:hypothetical protein
LIGIGCGFGGYLVIGLFFQFLEDAPSQGHFMVEGNFGIFAAGAVSSLLFLI